MNTWFQFWFGMGVEYPDGTWPSPSSLQLRLWDVSTMRDRLVAWASVTFSDNDLRFG